MRIFWTHVPAPLEEAVRACRGHFLMAAGLSALINVLYLAPTVYMMQVYDRVERWPRLSEQARGLDKWIAAG